MGEGRIDKATTVMSQVARCPATMPGRRDGGHTASPSEPGRGKAIVPTETAIQPSGFGRHQNGYENMSRWMEIVLHLT